MKNLHRFNSIDDYDNYLENEYNEPSVSTISSDGGGWYYRI